MTTTLQRTGTSLEVLAPYLPYGIGVRFIGNGHPQEVGTLLGLHSLNRNYPEEVVTQVTTRYPGLYLQVPLSKVLPVLRPFSALCTPLEGGEVPAVGVAKLFNPDSPEVQHGWHLATAERVRGEVWVRWPILEIEEDGSDGEQYWGQVVIQPNYQCAEATEDGPIIYDHRATDYFRSKHFAVGLSDTDFIAK